MSVGGGTGFLSYGLPIEGISRVDAVVGVVLVVHASASALPTITYGNEEQKGRFVPDLARGGEDRAFSLTEPATEARFSSFRP